ncbi:GAF domain-containing SpoIIE family protein phosphatase [Schlesneria sp. DSM 10557]|uniref:GAF domain-containing SpoIIE family protein phosphatase n=1 Tax=Schlesneria sp. DSM 10557 TaxID=3044399 RepID=UPI0035A13613
MTTQSRVNEPTTWKERLDVIVDMMRDMSQHTDPQAMVKSYGEKIQQLLSVDCRISISRRGLEAPWYRVTRNTSWSQEINPWKEPDRLPLLKGGLLGRLIHGDQPVLINDLQLDPAEPAYELLQGYRSLLAVPMYDQGVAMNMVIMLQQEPNGFEEEQIPDLVWRSNLFGRVTSNLVLKEELRQAYQVLDREMKAVGDIQRSLLPSSLPSIPTLDIACYYQPAQRAGGDYYDFFPMPDGKWGIFIADVSGHGTPAAVLMAVTHCIAHTHPGPPLPPGKLLEYLNCHLCSRYIGTSSRFVTGFYCIYDPARRVITYACAGHNPPRLKRCQDGSLLSLDQARGLPLGILKETHYEEAELQLQQGDQIIFYTDGITEAQSTDGKFFGTERLDHELEKCSLLANALLNSVLRSVERFANGRPADDDRTMIVARLV